MPVELECVVRDSRGEPVEGLPVYLSSEDFAFAGITHVDGSVRFVAPVGYSLYLYFYNPIRQRYVGKEFKFESHGRVRVDLEFELTMGGCGVQHCLGSCRLCGGEMLVGQRIYWIGGQGPVAHYDCFQNSRKGEYLRALDELLDKLEGSSTPGPEADEIAGYLEQLGFEVARDALVDAGMHPIAAFEAVRGGYSGRLRVDVLAVYPCKYPDMNLVLVVDVYRPEKAAVLDAVTFTPYKLVVGREGAGRNVIDAGKLPDVLKAIVAVERRIKGICG